METAWRTYKLRREEKAKAKRYTAIRLLDKSTKVCTLFLFFLLGYGIKFTFTILSLRENLRNYLC